MLRIEVPPPCRRLVKAGVVLAACMSLHGCDELCRNDVTSDVISPSGKHHAVVFQRDCGATTGFSVQVSVLPAGKRLENQGGNAFVADDGHDSSVPLNVVATWQ